MRGAARIVSATEAVAAIPSGATVAVGGFVGAAHPVLDKLKFRTCIIDEAAQALEPACVFLEKRVAS